MTTIQADTQRTAIRNQLDQGRQSSPPPASKRPIDKSLLSHYDLETLLQQFDVALENGFGSSAEYSGVFSFFLNLNVEYGLEVLNGYVLERIKKFFQEKVAREIDKRCVDIARMNATDLPATLRAQLALEQLSELYEGDACSDILLVVRNTDVPTMHFFSLAEQFQPALEAELHACVKRTRRCCLIFWANANTRPVEDHWQSDKLLEVPETFPLPPLRRWLKKELKDDHRYQRLDKKISEFQVVLIDEIDKADIDFPNDLLQVLEELRFEVDEVKEQGQHCVVDALKGQPRNACKDRLPLNIITSNREKELPKPFLRRCLFYYIEFPDRYQLADILKIHFEQQSLSPLFSQALDKFWELRNQNSFRWRKMPGTSEFLDWARILEMQAGLQKISARELEQAARKDLPFLEALIKTQGDREAMRRSE